MDKRFARWGTQIGRIGRARSVCSRATAAAVCLLLVGSAPVEAQEQLLFPAIEDAQQVLLQKIRNEQVRLDVAVWLLVDGEIVNAIITKHRSGVPVRVLGDRAAIFESDPNTRASFIQLADAGVPIRLRYHPTWYPEIMHWKSAIFVGQNLVEFGSANFTTFELAPWSPSNFKDETVLFSSNPELVRAFLTMFDRMWADTTDFLDWPLAYQRETGSSWPRAMNISTARLEPDYPTALPSMVWSQGHELITRMIAEIEAETAGIDLVVYRLTVPELADALIRRHRAGVRVRVLIEPTQYRNRAFPEYWLTGAMVDRLWAAGVPIRQRTHEGLTHMKTLITSRVAMNGSSNFTRFWQRDHNYFLDAAVNPLAYFALRDRFTAMWNDGNNFTSFHPLRPDSVQLEVPATGAANVSTSSVLVWRRAPWALAFDVHLGPDPANLPLVARVNAVVTEDPPETYSYTPPQGLQPSTRYYWRIVARTHATDLNPGLAAASELFSLVTVPTVTPPAPGPAACVGPSPGTTWSCVKGGWVPPATAPVSCSGPSPAPDWVCVNGGWLPPGHPGALGAAPSPPPVVNPPVSTPLPGTCATVPPGSDWICVDGGWLPPGHPAILGAAPAPSVPAAPVSTAPPSTCTTGQPGPDWICVNGGWVPPGSPFAIGSPAPAPQQPLPPQPVPAPSGSCTTPDPFVILGGGVCIGGGWVPKGHPAGGV